MGLTPQHALQLLRHAYAYTNGTLPLASWSGGWGERLPHNHHINVVAWTLQKNVTHVATHDIAFHTELVGSGTNHVEDVLV